MNSVGIVSLEFVNKKIYLISFNLNHIFIKSDFIHMQINIKKIIHKFVYKKSNLINYKIVLYSFLTNLYKKK